LHETIYQPIKDINESVNFELGKHGELFFANSLRGILKMGSIVEMRFSDLFYSPFLLRQAR